MLTDVGTLDPLGRTVDRVRGFCAGPVILQQTHSLALNWTLLAAQSDHGIKV